MDYAITAAGDEISAEDARALGSRRFSYRCPNCRARVRLVPGLKQKPHFRHVMGEADPACESYVRSFYGSGGSRGRGTPWESRRTREALRGPRLQLVTSEGGEGAGWWLVLDVPKSASNEGYVLISGRSFSTIRVDGARLARSAVRVRVRPEPSYRLEVEGFEEGYWDRVSGAIPGITEDRTVFTASTGRRMESYESFEWATAYFCVGAIGAMEWWHNAVQKTQLREIDRYRCAGFRLPVAQDLSVADWVRGRFQRAVRAPRPRLALVCPPACRDDSGAWLVEAGKRVVIGWSRPSGASAPREVVVKLPGEAIAFGLTLSDWVAAVDLGCPPSGEVIAWLDDDPTRNIVISIGEPSVHPPGPEVRLTAQAGEEHETAAAHSATVDPLLAKILAGRATLTNADLPTGVKCRVERTRAGEVVAEIRRCDAEELLEAAQDLREVTRLSLDFGSFGCVVAERRGARAPRALGALPRAVRARLTWLLSVSTLQPHRPWRWSPAVRRLARQRPDRGLLARLLSRQRWPSAVEPQLRAAEAELLAFVEKKHVR